MNPTEKLKFKWKDIEHNKGDVRMEENNIVKCMIELNRIFYPKNTTELNCGQYAIFSADIIKKGQNCEKLGSTIKLKGTVPSLEYFSRYNVQCELCESNEKYGDTYSIIFMNKIVDLTDKVKQRNFLRAILNENTVNRLFEKYDDVMGLLENRDLESLSKVKGVGITSAIKLCEKYEESKDYGEVYAELGHLGLTTKMIKRLMEYYKSPELVINTVKSNPYDMVNMDGIGFKKSDEIAQKVGISGSNPNRIKGCILYILNSAGESGKSYLHYSELMQTLYNNIGYVEQDIINEVAKNLMENKEVKVTNNGEFIGIKKYFDLECDIYNELIRLNEADLEDKFDFSDWKEKVKATEEEQGFDFTEEQINVIELFTNSNVLAMTGGAGVGKTTTMKGMTDLVNEYIIGAVALSGKASMRIKEATGIEASTIHRFLGYTYGGYLHNADNPLDIDILLIDESTMINGELFLRLLQATPSGAKVIMAGDVQQITPIGSCQVFADILNSAKIPSAKLTKPHRQALRSGIIPTSIKIINQEHIFKSTFEGTEILGELQDMELDIFKNDSTPSTKVVNHFLKHLKITNNIMETQVIAPTKVKGDLSVYNLNLKIQEQINPIQLKGTHITRSINKDKQYIIQVGDKVINTKNNYQTINLEGEITPVFNGNIGIVQNIEDGNCIVNFEEIGTVVMDKDASEGLELGYAISSHKSQGSGYHTVIVAIDSSAYVLLNAELLYTSITRAKKYCVLVGKNTAIRTCINNRETKKKQTYLKHLLNDEILYHNK
jgi:exodeoxyribonuclease V alpha subunit